MTQTTEVKDRGERATVTFHTSPENKARLEKLAAATKRSKSFLSNEALERYLVEEEDFITSVNEGLADVKAGRVHSMSDVKKALDIAITKVSK